MKTFPISIKRLAVLAFAAMAISCVSTSAVKSREDVAIAADFKPITPVKPDQVAIYNKLPTGKMTKISYSGKTYYVLKDSKQKLAYVGGPKQFQAYQQLGSARQTALESAQDEKTDERNKNNSAPDTFGTESAGYAGSGYDATGVYDGGDWGGWQGWGGWEGQYNRSNARAAYGWY